MRIVVSSDWHLDAVTAGMRRLEDVERAVTSVIDKAIEDRVDAFMFLGDLMNPDSGSRVFECMAVVIRAAQYLSHNGIVNFWIPGNHDVIEDGRGKTTLTPLRSLLTPTHGEACVVRETPDYFMMHDGRNKGGDGKWVNLILLPYPTLEYDYDPQEALDQRIAQIEDDRRHWPLIVAGHMTEIAGARMGSEGKEYARGRGKAFPEVRGYKGPVLKLNGHYHQQQEVNGIHIPGSLERLAFGEERNQPGWLNIEV